MGESHGIVPAPLPPPDPHLAGRPPPYSLKMCYIGALNVNAMNETPVWAIAPEEEGMEIPYFEVGVSAGQPSYVSEYFESTISLNEELVDNPKATFCVRVSGQSMIGAGINDGDLLIVDRDKEPCDRHIVLAVINGDFTVKRLQKRAKRLSLLPENKAFEPIEITPFMDFRVWGVVTEVIDKMAD